MHNLSNSRDTEAAFSWIISLLSQNNIQFKISGGLAARAYGSSRELVDIDIEIPESALEKIYPLVQEYVTFGPGYYEDENWKLRMITLQYLNQEIDLAGVPMQIFNHHTKQWEHKRCDFAEYSLLQIYGLTVPLETKPRLIEYKRKLGREVDLRDVSELLDIGEDI